jgi:putative glutamine amidotransferase
MRPKIAILTTVKDTNADITNLLGDNAYLINVEMSVALTLSGSEPCYITPNSIEQQLDELKPDGVLLPGGDFVFEKDYYTTQSVYSGAVNERFISYKNVLEYSVNTGTPLLGICAGMQVLGGYLGGKITPVLNHRNTGVKYSHKVKLNSRLGKYFGNAKEFYVNSNHNEMLIKKFGSHFNVLAESKDGVIEAIEPKKKWANFVVGVQWHPERLAMCDIRQKMIFDAFVNAARQRF